DVGDEEYVLVEEDPVGLGARRTVRRFRDDLCLDPGRVVLADLVFYRGRDEDVAVQLDELGVRDPLRTRETDDGPGLALVGVDLVRIEALWIEDAAARVRDGEHLPAELVHELRRERARVAEALHDHPRTLEVHPEVLRRLDDRVDRAARGRLVAAFAPADRERLTGDDRQGGVSLVHR